MNQEEIAPAGEIQNPGTGLQIWGDVQLREDAVIRAKVKGKVMGTGRIIVEEEAVVTGAVEGTDVRILGEVQGGVVGRGQVWIGPKARLKLCCHAQALRIESGAEFRGELQVG